MQKINASNTVSVSELKKSPTAVIDDAEGNAVAILNRNQVMAYLVPAATYEAMLDRLDDLDLVEVSQARANEQPVRINIEEL